VSVLLVTALLAGPLAAMAPQLRRSLAALTGTTRPVPRPTLRYSVHQFMQQVRAVTPETAGYLDPSQPPEYGILSPSVIGFAVNYSAQRPTSAGNFGPYAGRQGLVLTRRFYQARNEPQALALARRLRARYVITSDEAESTAPMMLHRLHQRDGSEGPKTPALAHFRLVTEGPPRGYPLGALTGGVPGNVVAPFKLFEVVEGAVLRVEAEPETEVVVTSPIETPAGRSFVYRTSGRTGGDGQVRIRVPYAQDGESPARPTGPYRIRAAGAVVDVSVSEDQVLRGAEIDVRLPAR
jgi:asparagine N-glycosylation enzyme membrane subunit Stt3